MIKFDVEPVTVELLQGDTLNVEFTFDINDFRQDRLVINAVKLVAVGVDDSVVRLTLLRNETELQPLFTRLIHALSNKELSDQFRYDLQAGGLEYAIGRLPENDNYQPTRTGSASQP